MPKISESEIIEQEQALQEDDRGRMMILAYAFLTPVLYAAIAAILYLIFWH